MINAKTIGTILFMIVRLLVPVREIYALDEPNLSVASAQLAEHASSEEDDIRVLKLEKYLSKQNSPLLGNVEDFVRYADIYGFGDNWAMVAAISGVESTFGKFIPPTSYNAWGWGIPTGYQSGIGFKDWEDGIETVSRGLRENYIDKGATELTSIGRIYAPTSTTWARNVRLFMNEIESSVVDPKLSL